MNAKSKLKVLALAASFAPVAFSAATYDYSDPAGDLIVTVASGTETMDASKVVSGVTNIIKRGTGTLKAAALTTYTGAFTIEKGVYSGGVVGDFGKKWGANLILVGDGATVVISGAESDTMSSKTMRLAGAAAEGALGKFVMSGNGSKSPGSCTIVLEDDATFYADVSRFRLGGSIDLGGNTLTLASDWKQFQHGGTIKNGGTLVVSDGTTLMNESTATYSGTGRVELRDDATLNYKTEMVGSVGWTLVNNGGRIRGNIEAAHTKTDLPQWEGPAELHAGNSSIASYDDANTPTVFNLKGPVTGEGKVTVGPGWLNLFGSPNTYSGEVAVVGSGKNVTGGGGIGVHGDAPLFPQATKVGFTKGASLELSADVAPAMPKLDFTDDTDKSILGGERTADGTRPTLAGFTKSGTGTLTVGSSVKVTGLGEVKGGTLRLDPKATLGGFGHAGLVEYIGKGSSAPVNSWSLTNTASSIYSCTGVKPKGPVNAYDKNDVPPYESGVRRCWAYEGYIWNRTASDVTWQFAAHFASDGGTFFIIDDDANKAFNGTGFLKKTITLSPGAHRLRIATGCWGNSHTRPANFSSDNPQGLGFLKTPNESATAITDFDKLIDPGDGSLLTVDAISPEDFHTPEFTSLSFAAGTTFDQAGVPVSLANLMGLPTLANAPGLEITDSWTLVKAAVDAGGTLAVNGTLRFGAGCVLSADNLPAKPGTDGAYVIATATSVEGAPTIAPDSPLAAKWKVETTATDVKLRYVPSGMVLIIR